VIVTIEGAHGFCTHCRRRLAADEIRPLFTMVAVLGERSPGDRDPQPAA
jgi:hypothetical protein